MMRRAEETEDGAADEGIEIVERRERSPSSRSTVLVERQLVSILIGCTDWPATRGMRGMFNHSCTVRVTLIWAPFGKLFDVFKMMNEKMNLEYNPAWTQLRACDDESANSSVGRPDRC